MHAWPSTPTAGLSWVQVAVDSPGLRRTSAEELDRVQVVAFDDDEDEVRPTGIANVLRRFSTAQHGRGGGLNSRRNSAGLRLTAERSWDTVTATAAPATLAQEGVRLCAKAQVARARRHSHGDLPADYADIPAMWPEGRSVQYAVREGPGGREEVRLCAGSPIGEVAFFGEMEAHTVRPRSSRGPAAPALP